MEDILASIRRIIADDQSRHANAAASASRRQSVFPQPPDPSPERLVPPEVPETPPRRVRPALDPLPPLNRAALSRRPRPGPASDDKPHPEIPHVNALPLPPELDFDHSVIDEIATVGAASALLPPQVATTPPETAPETAATPVSEAIAPPAPVSPIEEGAVAVEEPVSDRQPDPPAEPVPAAEPLVSPAADASIESAFNALATSVFLQNTGMVDGMVREMLRPLLKTWLEDNLPTIVERLVRVEIERVARGGRA